MARNIVVSDETERELMKMSIIAGVSVGDVVSHILATHNISKAQGATNQAQATSYDDTELRRQIKTLQAAVIQLDDAIKAISERMYT